MNRYRLQHLARLWRARLAARDLYEIAEPLISVLIPTYNRADLLVERSVASVLRQPYQNFEIVVVGDACTDGTEAALRGLGDPRIRFYNLPVRGHYPRDPYLRWLVAGSAPANRALELARGQWVAPLDDDDEFSPDHLEVLLGACVRGRREFAYGVMLMEVEPGTWRPVGSYPPHCGRICNASVLYAAYLRFFRYDLEAWRLGEPNDWNLWKRMWGAGVRMAFVDRIVGRHFLEHKPLAAAITDGFANGASA
ncbi:MAG TPA: glycosyltransferase family 2 protein [Candidatus Bathyarchaeia archaeon]|nr:glycosyltransferase family 2 protein [Candidatus Bathyarchaeia archaeon]